jgi:hypothetical protein
MFIFVFYIINYAYNRTQQPQFETMSSVNCIVNICITYDNIKECIHIGTPTLFKVDINTDHEFSDSAVKNVEFITIKEGCK